MSRVEMLYCCATMAKPSLPEHRESCALCPHTVSPWSPSLEPSTLSNVPQGTQEGSPGPHTPVNSMITVANKSPQQLEKNLK